MCLSCFSPVISICQQWHDNWKFVIRKLYDRLYCDRKLETSLGVFIIQSRALIISLPADYEHRVTVNPINLDYHKRYFQYDFQDIRYRW